MTLILLAISLTITLCVIAYNFAIYALPFMVGLTAFQYVYGMEAGFLMSGFAAIGTAVLGGTVASTVLGLFMVPVFFLLVRSWFKSRSRHDDAQEHAA